MKAAQPADRDSHGKSNYSRARHKPSSATRNWWVVDLGPAAFTLCSTSPSRGKSHEARHFLRVAAAASVDGWRRTETLSGRAEPTRTGGPLRLRLRLGGGT